MSRPASLKSTGGGEDYGRGGEDSNGRGVVPFSGRAHVLRFRYRVGQIIYVRRRMIDGIEQTQYHHAGIVSAVDEEGQIVEVYDFDPSLGDDRPIGDLLRAALTGEYVDVPRRLNRQQFFEVFGELGDVVSARLGILSQ